MAPDWHSIRYFCRLGLVLLSFGIIGSSLNIIALGQEKEHPYNIMGEETARRLENHTVMISLLSQDVKELKDAVKEQTAQMNTLKGIGIGFGCLMTFLHLVQFLADKKIKFVNTAPSGIVKP